MENNVDFISTMLTQTEKRTEAILEELIVLRDHLNAKMVYDGVNQETLKLAIEFYEKKMTTLNDDLIRFRADLSTIDRSNIEKEVDVYITKIETAKMNGVIEAHKDLQETQIMLDGHLSQTQSNHQAS